MGVDSSRTSSSSNNPSGLGGRRGAGAAAGSSLRPTATRSPWHCWEVVFKQMFYFTLSFICFLLVMSLFEVDDADIVASSRHRPLSAIHGRSIIQTASAATEQLAINQKNSTATSTSTTTTIGYVVTVTDCGEDGEFPFPITEGAAVLYYSIQRAHAAAAQAASQAAAATAATASGNGEDSNAIFSYDFKVYAVYHPAAAACAQTLAPLNYTLIPRDTPVAVQDIQGDYLREHIHTNGCCGERELIKLEAWRLTQHPLVVLLDLDCLIMQPLDSLFDFMLHGKIPPSDELQWPELYNTSTITASSSGQISLLYTLDYNMVGPFRRIKPIQGGFVVLRPSEATYQNLVDIVRVGDYRDSGGWGGKTMKFYGGMTIQGLLPFYWLVLNEQHNAQGVQQSVELNRCIYNNMASSHRKGWAEGEVNGTCYIRSPNNDCEDCRLRPIEQVKTTHFTVCQKPWLCQRHVVGSASDQRTRLLCRKLHHEWFRIRSEMEQSWGRRGQGTGNFSDSKHFYGYCDKRGQQGYHLIQKPYGLPVNNESDPAQVQILKAAAAAPFIAGDNAAAASTTRR